jgi:hypothetical protein
MMYNSIFTIDSMITQLETKFTGHNSPVYHINNVVPALFPSRTVDDLKAALEMYADSLILKTWS